MAIIDANNYFTGIGTAGYSPTVASQANIAPFTIDTAPLGLPTGSGGGSTPGYNAGSSINAGRDLGIGGEMWIEVLVTAAVTSASTASVYVNLVTDSTATIATTTNILLTSPTIAKATLVANYIMWRAQLPASLSYLRYIGLDFEIVTTNLSAGTFEGKLVTNIQQSDLYLSGIGVQ